MSLPLYYYLTITTIQVLVSWAIYLPYRMGQLHFTVVANMAVSAYVAAVAASAWGVPLWLLVIVAPLIGGLVGFLCSLFIGDAECFTVVMVGLTLIYLIRTVVESTPLFGGSLGIFNVPGLFGEPAYNRVVILILAICSIVIVGHFLHRFDQSSLGRAASTILADRRLAQSMGIDIKRIGMVLQTLSSAIGGFAGVLHLLVTQGVSPAHFSFQVIGSSMTILFLGGYSTPWGTLLVAPALLGAILVLPEGTESWRMVIYGSLLIITLMVRPEGLLTRHHFVRVLPHIGFTGRRSGRIR